MTVQAHREGTSANRATGLSAPVQLAPVAAGLSSPVAITHAGDGSGRLFIVEQSGVVRILTDAVHETPFLDIRSIVLSGGERGLLSIAFPPDHASSGRFYVFYTNLSGDLTIARYSVSLDPDVADPDGTVLLTIPHPGAANHNGGQLQFGPDGDLYVGTGDGGGGGDPFGHGQDLGVLLGKILRLDVGGESLIPSSNPFVDGDDGTRDEIWAYGLRNPWRFSFDRLTGDLFIGDVGQGCWEEVNRQGAGSPGGQNYGWALVEGSRCYAPPSCAPPPTCMDPAFTMPILTYSHDDPANCAITGGFVYRGAELPELFGAYLYADYCSGRISSATQAAGVWSSIDLLETGLFITSFGEDENGELYVADSGGGIWRIAPAQADPYADDFEDGNASDWTVTSGAWSVEGGSLVNAPASAALVLAPYGGCNACTIEADIELAPPGGRASVLAWYQDASTYVELRLVAPGGRLVLRKVKNGRTVARALALRPVTPGTVYHVALGRSGDRIEAFLDGEAEPALSVRDRSPASGKIGFRVTTARRRSAQAALHQISVH